MIERYCCIGTMSQKEKNARARAYAWVDKHMWLTNEARKYIYLEDLTIGEIIDLIEDNVSTRVKYPADLIGDLKRIA